jgi:hypothetical protein
MSNSFYTLYIEEVLRLSFTMVIKSSITAERINEYQLIQGYQPDVMDVDKKYYMNMAGEYHRSNTMMRIVSLDTLDEIDFTKENLRIHTATARDYRFGSIYYNDLQLRYPGQEDLIDGILNPVDKQTAIAAKDGTILYYDTSLVEVQEENLIPLLQKHCYQMYSRWHIEGYNHTDDYYPAAQIGVVYGSIPIEILNIRVENCHTEMAHSYHIREYLASTGKLDVYLSYLTLGQQLFLYRNLRWIVANMGNQHTFERLINEIITKRNLPLARYVVNQTTANMPGSLLPDIELYREPLNSHPGDGTNPERTLEYILRKEDTLARSNPDVVNDAIVDTMSLMQHSQFGRLDTKVLESALLDISDSVPHSFEDTLVNHWLYYAATHRMDAVVGVTHPVTGQRVSMSAGDAWIVYWFALSKRQSLPHAEIPYFLASRVLNPTRPTMANLKDIIIPGYVSDGTLQNMLDRLPVTGVYVSLDTFYSQVRSIYDVQSEQRLIWSSHHNHKARAMVKNAARRCFTTRYCNIDAEQRVDDWMDARGYDFLEFSDFNLDLLQAEILQEITQASTQRVTSLEEMQRAMLSIMRQLSSYSVQYIQTVNTNAYRVLDMPLVKIGDVKQSGEAMHYVQPATISVVDVKGKGGQAGFKPAANIGISKYDAVPNVSHFSVRVKTGVRQQPQGKASFYVGLPNMRPTWDEGAPLE